MLNRLIQIVTWGFFFLAIWIICKEIRIVGFRHIVTLLQGTPAWIIGLAGIGIVLNYFVLSGYDASALTYVGQKLPYPQVLKASSISFAFSNTTGHTYASGGAIRYLLYVPLGISKTEILKMIFFETLTVFIGLICAFELSALILIGADFFLWDSLFLYAILGIGALFFILGIIYIKTWVIHHKKFRIQKTNITVPSFQMTLIQAVLGLGDNLLLFAVFYTFLKYHINAPILETFALFVIAQSIGFMAQVPGGLGIFEGAFLTLFPHSTDQKSGILTSLILFRIFYYFVPFIGATIYLSLPFLKRKIFF